MAAVSSGNVARKKLADISNLPVKQLVRDGKPQGTSTVDHELLLKEYKQMMKILADRERILEVTGIELQKLRINQQKMQEQNKQLAQSNSYLLAEINASNETIKAFQHELRCKNGLIKALQYELKSQVEENVSEEVKLTGIKDQEDLATRGQDGDKQDIFHRTIHLKNVGSSRQVQSKEKAGNKRAYVRRQSARFKFEEAESTKDFCEIPETKLTMCPLPSDLDLEDGVASSVKDENKEGNAAISVHMIAEEVKLIGNDVEGELGIRGQDADEQDTSKRRIQSNSLGPSCQVQSKEKAANKRAYVRRQSARFKSEEAERTKDFCEIPETKLTVCPLPSDLELEDGVASSVKDENKEGNAAISVHMIAEEVKLIGNDVQGELGIRGQDADKQDTSKRRIQSKSLGPSCQVQSKEKAANKRACVRRHSSRFDDAKSTEDLCVIPETKLAVCPPPTNSVLQDGVASTVTTVKDEDKEENAVIGQEQGRPSIGRPSRVAAKKIQSYKEIPLKMKMRRPD